MALLLAVGWLVPLRAQTPGAPAGTPTPGPDIASLETRIAAIGDALKTGTPPVPLEGPAPEFMRKWQEHMEEEKRLLNEQIQLLSVPALPPTLRALLDNVPKDDTLSGPVSLPVFDRLRISRARLTTLQAHFQDLLLAAGEEQSAAERQWIDWTANPPGESSLQTDRELFDGRRRVLKANLDLQATEVNRLKDTLAVVQRELDRLAGLADLVRNRVVLSADGLKEQERVLDQREVKLGENMSSLQYRMRRLERSLERNDTTVSDELRALRLDISTQDGRLQLVQDERDLWQWRFQVINGKGTPAELAEWESGTQEALRRLERRTRLINLQFDEFVGRMSAGDESIPEKQTEAETSLRENLAEYRRELGTMELRYRFFLDNLQSGRTGERMAVAWEKVKSTWEQIWTFEIFTYQDRSVAVHNLLTGLLVLLVGVKIVRVLTGQLTRRLEKSNKLHAGSVSAISTLIFYAAIMLVVVMAIGVAGIPMTLFTLFGGALAIGLGFGSQTIINNFISGLILLIERPIRSGDMVEVDNTKGLVLRVGLRCTRVRTFDNVDLLVPNSMFLENRVINWTLTDDRYRAVLNVGLAYGSDTQLAYEILKAVAVENEKVLPSPKPDVFFTDFGDNSLNFGIYFWVRMRSPMDLRRVESAMRFEIDKRFREAGIVIAFPQRDIHLDTLTPLQVQMVPPPAANRDTGE